MDRIERDPNFETCPEYGGPEFDIIRTTLINTAGMTNEGVIQHLEDAWTQQKNRRVERWNQQLQNDIRLRQEAEQRQQEEENAVRTQREAEQEAERREAEKKKPKMNGFDANATVDDFIIPRPATYALNKLESFEYIELWYFTQEGCLDALENHRFQAEDALGFAKVGDTLALKQLAAVKASRNAIKDADLTWRQMTMARICFLQQAAAAGWPPSHVKALAEFFLNLEIHPTRNRKHGESILLLYQARVRRNWHDQLKRDTGFNIGIMNNALLQAISEEFWDNLRAESFKEVRVNPPPPLQVEP
jgi:hypothetical protein